MTEGACTGTDRHDKVYVDSRGVPSAGTHCARHETVGQFVRDLMIGGQDSPDALAPLAGERKHITILFADIAESTRLIAGRDPEDAYELLQPTIREMMTAVRRYGGTVNQVLGDGIMALFGAPAAQENHAVMACRAALAMQASLNGRTTASPTGISTAVRIGLNSGEVVVRAIRNDLEFDYRAIGPDVHLAARMQAAAKPGEVLLTAETARLARDLIEIEQLDAFAPKGFENEVALFRLSGIRPVSIVDGGFSGRPLNKLIGRRSELRTLSGMLETVREGKARVVGISGAPGIGKSRLVFEFMRTIDHDAVRVFRTAASPQDKAVPFYPLTLLIRQILGLEAQGQIASANEATNKLLHRIGVPSDVACPALLELLGFQPTDPNWLCLDPPDRRRHITDTILTILIGLCLESPTVLVADDLQWADPETLELVAKIVENLRTVPLLLILGYRTEFSPSWFDDTPHLNEIRLEPLKKSESLALVESYLGTEVELEQVRKGVVERTAGVPFFAEECVRDLVERRILTGASGAYQLATTETDIPIPHSVRDAISARIDRLPFLEKQVLLASSTIGKDFSAGLLKDVVGLAPDEFSDVIDRLRAGEFVDEVRLFPEAEFAFHHALIHEVAYGSLLREQRQALHSHLVDIMEARYGKSIASYVERLSHHATEGHRWDKAFEFSRLAGQKALKRSAIVDAVRYFEVALDSLDNLPSGTGTNAKLRADTLIDLADASFPLGLHENIINYVTKAQEIYRSIDDQRGVGRASSILALHSWMTGDLQRARDHGEAAFSAALASRDRAFQIHATARLGAVCLDSGDYETVVNLFSSAVNAIHLNEYGNQFGLAGAPAAVCRAGLAWSLAELGDFDRSFLAGQEGLQIAREVKHAFSEIFCSYEYGNALVMKGDAESAIPVLEGGLETCESASVPLLLPPISAALGHAYSILGRNNQAIQLLEGACEQAEEMKLVGRLPRFVSWLGEAYFRSGQFEDARRQAEKAIELAEEAGQHAHGAWALRLAGLIRTATNSWVEAEASFNAALQLARDWKLEPLVAHCLASISIVKHHTSTQSEATNYFTFGADIYRKLGMNFWLKEAHRISDFYEMNATPDNIVSIKVAKFNNKT